MTVNIENIGEKMKALVAYYSRTGNTKKVAEQIAKVLKADIDEIIDKKNRKGMLGPAFSALTKRLTQIRYKKTPSKYDIIIIGTPIWAGRIPPAVRTYLSMNKPKKVAFFCTKGGSQGIAFKQMEELTKKPIAVLEVLEKEIKDSNNKIKVFCSKLKGK